ncbi:MAG: hypothetical protein IJZ23_06020 [Roseburia sp.]|nr:hypothetical protein [Roseburia sp.]
MKIFLVIVVVLFAGLHALAAITHAKNSTDKRNDILMILGAVIALACAGLCVMRLTFDWILALVGFGLIIFVAIQNGRQKENLHIQHHFVRIVISIVLVIGLFSY